MLLPVVYANVLEGIRSADRELLEDTEETDSPQGTTCGEDAKGGASE